MKKSITSIVVGLLICFTVKAQHIPDNNFANAIRNVCNECIDANNNLLPPAKKLEKLNVNEAHDIVNIEGVEGFSSLIVLDFRNNKNITSLPNLPVSLGELWMGGTGVNNIGSLPSQLRVLDCGSCPITSLPALPAFMTHLFCDNTRLSSLPDLPATLEDLYCNNTPITSLPKLPVVLWSLKICNTKITTLPLLPDGLGGLNISDSTFSCIPSNNAKLWIRDIDGNRITTTICKEGEKPVAVKDDKPDLNTVTKKLADALKGFFKDDEEKKVDKGKCVTGNCINGIGTYEFKEGEADATYKGSFKEGKFNGQGTLVVKDKYKYTGSFKDGQIDGKGMFTYSDGNVYTGEMQKGNIEGTGTLVYKDGKKTTGIWKGNKLWSGTGFFIYGDKESYYGEVNENKPDGQGVYTYANGKKFTGTFSKGETMSGKGYLFYPEDKSSYEGTLVNGKYNGIGIYTNSNGQIFNGNFVDGALTGTGKCTGADGRQYDGNFKNTKFDGYGVLTYKNGSVYKGNWAGGLKNGNGSFYDENGNLDYSGEWSNGKMTNPKQSASYKNSLWEQSKQMFSRVTFKGWLKAGEDGVRDEIIDEYHLNSDYSLYGTTETIIKIDGAEYGVKRNITGTFDPVSFKIHTIDGSLIYRDELPPGLHWETDGTADYTIYRNSDHPGYYIIEGKDDNGNISFSETDYY